MRPAPSRVCNKAAAESAELADRSKLETRTKYMALVFLSIILDRLIGCESLSNVDPRGIRSFNISTLLDIILNVKPIPLFSAKFSQNHEPRNDLIDS